MQIIRYISIFYFFFGLFPQVLPAHQVNVDSLKNILASQEDDSIKLQVCRKLINYYTRLNIDSVVIFANQASEYIQRMGKSELQSSIDLDLGNVFFYFGNYGRSIEYYYRVLKGYELESKKGDLIVPFFNIALVNDKLGDNLKAREYYTKALEVAESLIADSVDFYSKPLMGRIYNNLGITFHNAGEYEKALDYYHKGITISEKLNNSVALPFIYNNIGLVYKEMKDYQIAFSFFRKSLEMRLANNDLEGIALTYEYYGDTYSLMGNNKDAVEFYQKAYSIAHENQFTIIEKNISEQLVLQYAAIGKYKDAFDMHLIYKTLSDSLNLQESTKRANMLEQQYKFDKIQKEMELEKQKRTFRAILYGGILITLLIIITMLFLLAQSKMKRIRLREENLALENERLETELEFKNKELTTNVMYLLRKNELINNISLKLLDMKSMFLKANQEPVQKIINELQRSVDDDVWKEFEFRFKDVHEDFYKALNERFPDLTQNERKLCAFLRLNMSTKDISAITFQSPHSITIARSRLRKKLNLTNSEVNLVDFLSTIG